MVEESVVEQEEREEKEREEGIKRIEDIDTRLLEKAEWFMEKIKMKVNKSMKEWKLPIRIITKKSKENIYYFWAEQKRRPSKREDGMVLKRGRYKYIAVNFTWRRMRGWNKGIRKISNNPKRGWIFSFTGKKISRWNRELQKLYRVRRSIKKIQRDKERTERKIRKLVADGLGALGLEELKYSVKREWRFEWAKILDEVGKADLWELGRMLRRIEGVISRQDGEGKEVKRMLREVRKAKKRIEEILEEREKIHRRAGKKLYKINERITAIDKLWYPTPPIRLDLPAPDTENQKTPL